MRKTVMGPDWLPHLFDLVKWVTREPLTEAGRTVELTELSHHFPARLPNRCFSRKTSGCQCLSLGEGARLGPLLEEKKRHLAWKPGFVATQVEPQSGDYL